MKELVSNNEELEDIDGVDEQAYAKSKVGVRESETKNLGVSWDKTRDQRSQSALLI